jgi:hypothetical protein
MTDARYKIAKKRPDAPLHDDDMILAISFPIPDGGPLPYQLALIYLKVRDATVNINDHSIVARNPPCRSRSASQPAKI